jgi:hypothetical protein
MDWEISVSLLASFSPGAAWGDSAALLSPRSFAPYNRVVRICQLMNYYYSNDRAMPNDGSEAFRASLPFPCQAFD